MSTPTPIEIVRESLAKLQDPFVMFHARPEKKAFTIALASVLADAERFQALERAHADPHGMYAWGVQTATAPFHPKEGNLAELADRLREGGR